MEKKRPCSVKWCIADALAGAAGPHEDPTRCKHHQRRIHGDVFATPEFKGDVNWDREIAEEGLR